MEHYNDWFGNDWCGETRDEEWALIDAIKNSVRDDIKQEMERLRKEQKTQTNADKIRSMTDEELARAMDMVCPPDTACNDGQQCIKCWIDWLKQPAKE